MTKLEKLYALWTRADAFMLNGQILDHDISQPDEMQEMITLSGCCDPVVLSLSRDSEDGNCCIDTDDIEKGILDQFGVFTNQHDEEIVPLFRVEMIPAVSTLLQVGVDVKTYYEGTNFDDMWTLIPTDAERYAINK